MFKKILQTLTFERNVLLISNNKIINKKIGIKTSICLILSFFWFCYATVLVLKNNVVVTMKNQQINDLKNSFSVLDNEYKELDFTVKKIKNYVISLNYYDRFEKLDISKIVFDKSQSLFDNKEYVSVKPVLDRVNNNLTIINDSFEIRGEELEKKIKENIYQVDYKNKDIKKTLLKTTISDSTLKRSNNEIIENISYLSYLENFINTSPVVKPMNSFRVTSKFGIRSDPFKNSQKVHKGLDIAGPLRSKILAPAEGTVIYASKKGAYGNHVILKHANNIVTTYSHLDRILVEEGSVIKRGEAIGTQGNTGRSTGSHLHFEVKSNGKYLNPERFLSLEKELF